MAMHTISFLWVPLLVACGDADPSPKPAADQAGVAVENVAEIAALPPESAGPTTTETGAGSAGDASRTIDKGAGLVVEVLSAGTGPAVRIGQDVTLEYTISYVPKPVEPAKAEDKKDSGKGAKGAKKREAPAKPEDKKGSDKPADEAQPESKVADETHGKEHKPTEPKPAASEPTSAAKSETAPSGADAKPPKPTEKPAEAAGEKAGEKAAEPADAKTSDKPSDKAAEKPAEKPAQALEPPKPVIVASTKGWTTPCVVRLGRGGQPALCPGFARGLEGLAVGTRARITVPPELLYGKQGNPSAGIPADTPVQIEVFVRSAR